MAELEETQVKQKSPNQVRYLLSSGSPLTKEQKDKLKRELHSGAVKITGSKRTKARKK